MKSIALVDLSQIWRAKWHASADDELSTAFEKTVADVRKACSGRDYAVVALDMPPYDRRKISDLYKANREAQPPQAIEQFDRVKARLRADGFLLWGHQGAEADDVIASAVKLAVADGLDVTIVSGDKDLLQCVSDANSVRCLSPVTGVVYTEEQVKLKFGVGPELIGDWLALVGDSSDNIKGIDGVGAKRATAMLVEFGSLTGVLSNADKATPKIAEALFSGANDARLARKLVELRTDIPLDWKQVYEERKLTPLTTEADYDDAPDAPHTELDPPSEPKNESVQVRTPDFEEATPKGNALATTPGDWSMSLEPATLGIAYKLAQKLVNSRLYSRLPNAEAIWAIIIRGREMGLGALTALDCFHLVEGKPCPHAHLLISRAMEDPDCEYFQFLGGDDTFAEYETKHRKNPKPTRLKYTIQQAEAAGMLFTKPGKEPGNWHKRRAEMLRKTCAVQLGRIVYPGRMMGLVSIEEMSEAA